MPRLREFRYDAWADWAAELVREDGPSIIALDSETSGVAFHDAAFCFTLTWRGRGGAVESAYIDIEAPGYERRVRLLGDILRSVPAWVGHNLKYDAQKGILAGVFSMADLRAAELHDSQTLYYLCDENGRKGLKHLAATVLNVDDTIEVEIKSGPNKGQTKWVPKEEHRLKAVRRTLKLTKDDGYHLLPRDVLIPYALKDTEFTLRLYETLYPRLVALNDPRLLDLYRESMELKLVLLEMESDGFKLDLDYLKRTTSEYGVRVMEGWERVVTLTGDPLLNPQSPQQLTEAFKKRGIHLTSTAESELKALDDELARALLEYRAVKKTHTTYLVALQREQRDGIIHPNFREEGARTGRMSSGTASA